MSGKCFLCECPIDTPSGICEDCLPGPEKRVVKCSCGAKYEFGVFEDPKKIVHKNIEFLTTPDRYVGKVHACKACDPDEIVHDLCQDFHKV